MVKGQPSPTGRVVIDSQGSLPGLGLESGKKRYRLERVISCLRLYMAQDKALA